MEDPRLFVFVSHQCKHELCDVSLTPAAVLNLSEITENYNRLPDDEARARLQQTELLLDIRTTALCLNFNSLG